MSAIIYEAANGTSPSIGELLSRFSSDPQSAVIALLTFLIGAAIGYILVKISKYAIALIVLLILGSMLSLWNMNITFNDMISRFGPLVEQLRDLVIMLGLVSFSPMGVGFAVGVIIGILRR